LPASGPLSRMPHVRQLPPARPSLCVGFYPQSHYLTTLGEAASRWIRALADFYALISRSQPPADFHVKVPWVPLAEKQCVNGRCRHNGTILVVSLAALFPHRAPALISQHTIRYVVGSDCRTHVSDNQSLLKRVAQQPSSPQTSLAARHSPVPAPMGFVCRWDPILCCPCGSTAPNSDCKRLLGSPRDQCDAGVRVTPLVGLSHDAAHRNALGTIMVNASDALAESCGYLFIRRPLLERGGRLYTHMHDVSQREMDKPNTYVLVPLEQIARTSRLIAAQHSVSCLEVNFNAALSLKRDAPDNQTAAVIAALNQDQTEEAGVRFYHQPRKPGAVSNARAMHSASTATVLITELGTQWTDFPLQKRCVAGLKSFVVAHVAGETRYAPVSCNIGLGAGYGSTLPFCRSIDPMMSVSEAFGVSPGSCKSQLCEVKSRRAKCSPPKTGQAGPRAIPSAYPRNVLLAT